MSEFDYSKLSNILKEVGLPDPPENFTDSKIFSDWLQSAGENIANNTTNLSIDGATISVTVTSPTWAHSVLNSQSTILTRLGEFGHKELTEMTIRVSAPTSGNLPQTQKLPTPEQPKREIDPQLKKLFAEIANNAKSPRTREAFLRLSKIKLRDN